MTDPTKIYRANFLKEETSDRFSSWFKKLIFASRLSYGCRLYLLTFATHSPGGKYSPTKHARKLGVQGNQIRKWHKEAEASGVDPFHLFNTVW